MSACWDALINLAGGAASTIARAEGLDAHARAIELKNEKCEEEIKTL